MAITASGLYAATFVSALSNSIALDLGAEDMRVALFSNTITPNFTTDTAYAVAPYNANEVTGTNWASGGVLLTSTTLTASAGNVVFDAADVSVANATFTGARGALVYADALAGNNAVALINLTSDQSPSNGTFTIQWSASGIFVIDVTP